jgi:hypothetical protein
MSATLARQFAGFARYCLELARSADATHRARFVQMAHQYWLASLRIRERPQLGAELAFVDKSPSIHVTPCPRCPDWPASQPSDRTNSQ